MLTKDVCLMLKACVKLVESVNYQVDSLFSIIDAVTGNTLPDNVRETFRQAAEHLRKNAENVQNVLDQVMEKDGEIEEVLKDLPKRIN